MESRYKIIISNNNLYKEIQLEPVATEVRVGTGTDCDIRLRKDLFFGYIRLTFQQNNGEWSVFCSENLYFTANDARKLMTKTLIHGDELTVKYQESGNDVLQLSFMLDFDYEQKDYRRKIDISLKSEIRIGGSSQADIYVEDAYLGKDAIRLVKTRDSWEVVDEGVKYGVYVNGARIEQRKRISSMDFFAIAGYSFYLKDNDLYTTVNDEMHISGLSFFDESEQRSHLIYPKFNRNTRIQYRIPEVELEIQQPVQKPGKPRKNLAVSLIPALVMLAMTILLRGVMGGGGTFVIYSAVSMSMGIIMSVVTFIQEKKTYQEEDQKRINTYNAYIEKKREEIEQVRANELRVRNLIYESLESSVKEADDFGKRLFERTVDDPDFLQVYLGRGRIRSANQVEYTKQEFVDPEDSLATIPEAISKEYQYIEDAPIVADFRVSNGVGVVGAKEKNKELLKNITLDLALRHFYREVKFVYIFEEEDQKGMEWVRWLHNVENSQLDVKNIICDEESKNLLLENLYSILSERESIKSTNKEAVFDEQYIVFVTSTEIISSHPISKFIKNSTEYGFTFVFFVEYAEYLPLGCTEVISLGEAYNGNVLKTVDGDNKVEFLYPNISNEQASYVALRLGATMVDEVSLEGQLTKNITMFELLNIISIEDLNLEERWNCSMVYKSLAAPIGVKGKNEIVSLDIGDKAGAHGPHGLVAGTTGSGKSEVLQTYILSMVSLYHPYEVGFVVIDFKGGGMANQFKNLPHLIGTITNIDGREINRSLLSIKAELIKRQERFSACGVNHINDYIKLYKAGKVDTPLPHLIMIVDEFAELKSEYPDFMKEIISAARIGRTLGIHLILATQKPAGVVDNQIWSNSKFKLCLKVQTKEDSNEVLKTPLAAEIVEPGRAYFQVGNNEIFELFQSAYSGSNVPTGNEINERTFSIHEVNIWGKKKLVYTNKKKKVVQESTTQLQAIVDYVSDYCEEKGIKRLPGICLPSLPDVIKTDALQYENSEEFGIVIPVGIYDDPEQQRQGEVLLEPSKENIYIVGSAQSGKTVLLQTIVYGLMKKYTTEQINLYLVDCGSMVLKIFETSSHVGGVVLSNEEEKCKNLFKLLNTMIIERKKQLSGIGVGNYAAYLEAGYTDMPMVVVIIDNMAAFKEYFPGQAEELNSLSREAQGVGISLIITAPASNALNYRTQSNFGKKIVLNCNDANEYSNVFGHCKETPKENAGRGLFMYEKRILEYQAAIFGESEKEADRSQEMVEYIKQRNGECAGKARAIPMVPEELLLMESMKENSRIFRNRGMIPIGMDFATVDYSILDMNAQGSLTLLGDEASKAQFVINFMRTLNCNIVFHNVVATVIDDRAKSMQECREYGFVRAYVTDTAEALVTIAEFADEMARRREEEREEEEYTLLVINNADVFRRICSDKNSSKSLAELIKTSNESAVFVLIANGENQPVGFNSSEVLKAIKDERKAILFAQLSESKLFDIQGRIHMDSSFGKSIGYRFDGGTYTRLKIFE